jgi:ribonuclease BN (tRNA processing enzyme)
MRLRVLGCRGGWPGPDQPCSGYLLEAGDQRILIDVGAGVLPELLRHVTLPELDAIWVSHLHPDHCGDLPIAWHMLAFGTPREHPLPVFGPPGWPAALDAMLSGAKEIADVVEIVELTDGARHEFGDLELRAVAVRHSMPTFGLRASHAGTTLGYPSDSGPCPGVDALARGADLFLCETFLSLPELRSDQLSTPEDAGKAAAAGGARRLVLTHLHPDADPVRAVARAATEFAGPIEVAEPGRIFEVHQGDP